MIEQTYDLLDSLRGNFPLITLVIVPLIMAVSPVNGAQNFPVYRVQQYDLGSSLYGSRNTLVNMEANTLSATMLTRRCVVTRAKDITVSQIRDLIHQNAGALLILVPNKMANLSDDFKQSFLNLEEFFLGEEIPMPVYLAEETEEVTAIYEDLDRSSDSKPATASEALFNSISANGFQFNVPINSAKKLSTLKTMNIHGVLEGKGDSDQLPTLVLVAHYDSFGMAPSLSYGAASAGSVALLLELMRLFSRLYQDEANRASYNLVFLASGSSNMNYFGSKKWIEEFKDSSKFPYLTAESAVVCLDALTGDGPIMAHSTKEYPEGTPMYTLVQHIRRVAVSLSTSMEYNVKKVPLLDVQLAWEHQMFRMQQFRNTMTLSTFGDRADLSRRTMLNFRSDVDAKLLTRNTQVIGEAVARLIYERPTEESKTPILTHQLSIEESMIVSWLNLLASEPRSPQLFTSKSQVIVSLEAAFKRFTGDSSVTAYTCDPKDPEFVMYDATSAVLDVYSVKPALFDLILAFIIAVYLASIYGFLQFVFPSVASLLMKPKNKTF